MEKDTKQNNYMAQNVRKQFDQTLSQYIERLIGSRYGVGGLPINLTTISCIILLTERENEIDSYPYTSSERHTYETLLKELSEIGLDPDEDLEMELQDMIQKGYIDVADNGRYFARKPTISMAKLLDRIFPKMPGMNFIAYFVQTIDEARSGRKDLDSAISQFDQTLQMQGVSLLKQKSKPKLEKPPGRPVKRRAKLKKTKTPNISASGSKIISSEGNLGQVEIRELFAEQDELLEKPEEMDEAINAQETEIPEEAKEEGLEPGSDKQNLFEDSVYVPESVEEEKGFSTKPEMEGAEAKTVEVDEALHQTETKPETESVQTEDSLEKADDIIEKQITALEEDLAMQCPICKKGKSQAEETRTGKIYYKCSNKDCNFISWGKPYHIVCPQCQNPFLVETSNRDGKTILKCPRATCSYWQRPPGEITEEYQEKAISQAQGPDKSNAISRNPRRRFVRRRVVRRKR